MFKISVSLHFLLHICISTFRPSYPNSLAFRPWLYYMTVTFHRTTWSSVTPFTSSLPRWENNLHSKKPLALVSKTRKSRLTYTCCRLAAISRNKINVLWQNQRYLTCHLVVLKENNCLKNLEKHMIKCTSSQGRCI